MTIATRSNQSAREGFYRDLKGDCLAPLWEVLSSLVTREPISPAITAKWSYEAIRPKLMQAGKLITAQEAERRVLILENPALPGQSRITSTLYAGLQLILPGEVAPAHRHTQCALRFIMEGRGAFTALDGERAPMEKYDLILTPNWVWHDHGNEGDEPVVWLDGLDIPLITALDASFAELRADKGAHPRTRPDGDAQYRFGRNLRPVRTDVQEIKGNPLFIYRHDEWRAALDAMEQADEPHAHDGWRMEFINPVDGGPVMATISAFTQMLPAGFEGAPLRSTDGMVLVVTEGEGVIEVNDTAHQVKEGDIIVVPAWARRSIRAKSRLVLFSYSDKATQQKLSLWREELL